MTEGILLAATGLLVVLTFLPLWKNPVWWVRGLDFPRLQLCVLAFALLLAQPLGPDFLLLPDLRLGGI